MKYLKILAVGLAAATLITGMANAEQFVSGQQKTSQNGSQNNKPWLKILNPKLVIQLR